jgi:lysophospholipase L1-like esterase
MEKAIHYLAFGDSLTTGFGAPPDQGFVSVLKGAMEEAVNIPVYLNPAGTNGATTGQLLQLLETEPELIHLMQLANVITITAGGNDLIHAALPYIQSGDTSLLKSALQGYEMNYKKIVAHIEKIKEGASRSASSYVLILIGLYNPLPKIPESAVWVERFNLFLSKLQKRNIYVVQVYAAFKGKEAKLLYTDHVHPNAAGYQVMADQVVRAVPLKLLRNLV